MPPMKKLICFVFLCSAFAFSQGYRFDQQAHGPQGPLSNVTVTLCSRTATGIPCSPQVQSYMDQTLASKCASGSPVVFPATTGACSATSDANGNLGFWLQTGTTYVYTITGTNITGQSFVITIPSYNARQMCDQFDPGSDASVKINHCIAAVIAQGGGIADATALGGNQTLSAEIDVGNGDHPTRTQLTLILPQYGTWTVPATVSRASGCAVKQFTGTTIQGFNQAGLGDFQINTASGASLKDVYCTEFSPTGGGSYMNVLGGLSLKDTGRATTSNGGAVAEISELFDASTFDRLSVSDFTGVGLWIHGICCTVSFTNTVIDGSSNAGAQNLKIGGTSGEVEEDFRFDGLSVVHQGANKNAILLDWASGNNGIRNASFRTVYFEETANDGDTSTAYASINGALDISFDGVKLGTQTDTGTRYLFDITTAASAQAQTLRFRNVRSGVASPGLINNHISGRTIARQFQADYTYSNTSGFLFDGDNFEVASRAATFPSAKFDGIGIADNSAPSIFEWYGSANATPTTLARMGGIIGDFSGGAKSRFGLFSDGVPLRISSNLIDSLDFDTSGNATFPVSLKVGGPLTLGGETVQHHSHFFCSGFSASIAATQGFQRCYATQAVTVEALDYNTNNTPGAGCTTQPTIDVCYGSPSSTCSSTITMTNGNAIGDSTITPFNIPAGTVFAVRVETGPAGCATNWSNVSASATVREQ